MSPPIQLVLEPFNQPWMSLTIPKAREDEDSDIKYLSGLFANKKKGHFMKGDPVIVVKGKLKNLKGWVEKENEENVYIRPKMLGSPVSRIGAFFLLSVFKPFLRKYLCIHLVPKYML